MACVEFSGRTQGCRQLQDLVGPTQLLDLTLEFFHSLRLSRGYDAADTGVDLMPLRLAQQGCRHTADLRRHRLHRGSQRWVISAVLLRHAGRALAKFGGILRGLAHGSILSGVGAPQIPGRLSWRYWRGVRPVRLRKCRDKPLWSQKPVSWAISPMGLSVRTSHWAAESMRNLSK